MRNTGTDTFLFSSSSVRCMHLHWLDIGHIHVGTFWCIIRMHQRVSGQYVWLRVRILYHRACSCVHVPSPYLESFPGPVIGVMKGEFDFEPLGWPSTTEIRSRVVRLFVSPIFSAFTCHVTWGCGRPLKNDMQQGDLKEEFERPSFEDNWWQMQVAECLILCWIASAQQACVQCILDTLFAVQSMQIIERKKFKLK